MAMCVCALVIQSANGPAQTHANHPHERAHTQRTTRQCQIGPRLMKNKHFALLSLSPAGGKDDWVGERWDYG